MTEKRYYCNENFVVIDSKTEKSCSYFKCMNLLNEKEKEIKELEEENKQLKKENKHLQCTIESNSQDDYINFLEKQNEILKERIEELASNNKIVFMTG